MFSYNIYLKSDTQDDIISEIDLIIDKGKLWDIHSGDASEMQEMFPSKMFWY